MLAFAAKSHVAPAAPVAKSHVAPVAPYAPVAPVAPVAVFQGPQFLTTLTANMLTFAAGGAPFLMNNSLLG